ncbi:tumor necrosis factor receptor superfamily member 14 isoform X2 [Bombina bombina]|uniref:tumor necrosis factor receptor superfamily member 14 isoform X2 n=1 Tax=Bombina bombina TaxID=8345 RepID=UPI00235B29E6|nr:tumor necrosis factor receptor superfamily member 14 isoform X2 [Bombina bombina]
MSENSLLPWIIYFSLAILVQSLKCKPGDYEIDNECCPMCLSGSVVKNHCTSHISTECVPCVPPTYMDHPNGETKCLKCKICDAGAGLIIQKPCTYTSNTVCECQFGYFCPEDSGKECDLCQEHTKCKPGKIIKKIGDSGYPCRTWLLTPVPMPHTRGEIKFNESHRSTRSAIERTFGVLKMRFRVLDRSGGALQYSPEKCNDIILVACMLHNIAISQGNLEEECPNDPTDDTYIPQEIIGRHTTRAGVQNRLEIIERYFS